MGKVLSNWSSLCWAGGGPSLQGREVPWEDGFWGYKVLVQSPLAGEEPNGIAALCFVLYSPGKASLSSLGIKILV